MSIGTYLADAMPNIHGLIQDVFAGGYVHSYNSLSFTAYDIKRQPAPEQQGIGSAYGDLLLDISLQPGIRIANETRGASVSVYVCITY
jgi:hypothetical protein